MKLLTDEQVESARLQAVNRTKKERKYDNKIAYLAERKRREKERKLNRKLKKRKQDN